jgi:peptidoglycan/LPS O-acetylase OafA/YrhL
MTATTSPDPEYRVAARADGRNAGLDLLRGLACLLVVAFHLRNVLGVDFGPLDPVVGGGDTGVFVFFALSGYLLYRPFLRGPVELGSYAIKRTARILPGYFVALSCLAALTQNLLPAHNVLPYVTMTATYNVELRAFLGNAWTLSAEIIFYLLLPAIARLVAAAPIPRLAILALVSVVASAVYGVVDRPGIEWIIGAFPLVFYAFVPGMLLAVIEVRDPAVFRRFSAPWVGVAGVAAITIGTLLHNFPVALGAGIGTFLLMGWLASVRLPFGRALAFAGGASYAMYLWHKDLFITFGGIGLLVAVIGAAASWAMVERPILELAHAVAAKRRDARPGVLLVDTPVPASPQ